MKKKSMITIMMLITFSTVIFMGCNNNEAKNDKEEIKIENSIDNNKKDSKESVINKQNGNKSEYMGNNPKKTNKAKMEDKNVNGNNGNEKNKNNENLKFNPQQAIEIAKGKYGTQNGNILYSYKEEPYISGDKKGYYIKLSSKTMIEQGGTGTLTWLLVTNDGNIIEDPRMN